MSLLVTFSQVNQTIETHYDCLKVVRDAPVEVIKASYRVLSQKYHPDRNAAPDAVHLMTRINQAWDVLSDPERRATHDRWIATQERNAAFDAAPAPLRAAAAASPRHTPRPARARASTRNGAIAVWASRYGIGVAAALAVATAIILLVSYIFRPPAPMDFDDALLTQNTPADTEKTVWLAKPWEAVPTTRLPHGYIDGEEQYYSDGLSTFDIDNTDGGVDAEVRLYRNGRTVRSMFVHRGQHFVAEKLPAGTYTLKYKVAVDGKMRAWAANADYQLNQVLGEGQDDTFTQAHVTLSGIDGGAREIPLDQI